MSTDRAKRYAANRAIEDDKRAGCLFCRSKKFLTVDHLSGDESDGNPANLAWLCKSCNTRKGAAFRKAGIGRLTHQYNPKSRRNDFTSERIKAHERYEAGRSRPQITVYRGFHIKHTPGTKHYFVEDWTAAGSNIFPSLAKAKAAVDFYFQVRDEPNPDLGLSPQERKNFQQLGFDFPPRGEYDAARSADRKRRQSSHATAIRDRREARQAEARRKKADRVAEQKQLREGISRLGLDLQRARKAGDKEATRELVAEINDLTSDLRRNPAGIRSARQWQEAVNAVVGAPSYMSTESAASRIRATGPAARRKFGAVSLRNPAGVPTYAQYAFAVSGYNHGQGDPALSEIIHRTPKAKRAEYARRIAGAKRSHGTEHLTGTSRTSVPF
jgi:hypothetical protein